MKSQKAYRPVDQSLENFLLKDEDLVAAVYHDLAEEHRGKKGPVKIDPRLNRALLEL
jgi:hypothetical protein